MLFQIKSYPIISYQIISNHIISYYIISCYIILCYIIVHHIISYYVISLYIILYHIMLYHCTSYYIILYFISYLVFNALVFNITHPHNFILIILIRCVFLLHTTSSKMKYFCTCKLIFVLINLKIYLIVHSSQIYLKWARLKFISQTVCWSY